MRNRPRPGFTLVELLVVIMIIGLLIALMLPSINAVWNQLLMTQCRVNLSNIFKAQSLWRADQKTVQFATGPNWPSAIRPYLEEQDDVLLCPARQDRGFGEEEAPASSFTLDDIVVKVYDSNPGMGRGDFLYEVPMTAPFPIWKVVDLSENQKEFLFCDYAYWGWQGDWDIQVTVTFQGIVPVYMDFDENAPGVTGHYYQFDIWICGEFNQAIPSLMAGQDIDLGGYGSHPSDYAISRGLYEVIGRDIPFPDSKLFFTLDYAKSVADYREPVGGDDWTLYFVDQPGPDWEPPRLFEGLSWQDVTALRHFRMANVLFADSHVEAIGLNPNTDEALSDGKYLRPDSPLWRHTGL